jgi:sulfate transport system ATP-binding protein
VSIELQHISKTFGPFRALDDISLVVPDGRLVALLGPSGCGKTTLLRIIAGLETPDPGEASAILFKQRRVLAQNVRARQVGFVFQHYALFRHMTVAETSPSGCASCPGAAPREAIGLESTVAAFDPARGSGGPVSLAALGGSAARGSRSRARSGEVCCSTSPSALDARVRLDLRRWLQRLRRAAHHQRRHDQEERSRSPTASW